MVALNVPGLRGVLIQEGSTAALRSLILITFTSARFRAWSATAGVCGGPSSTKGNPVGSVPRASGVSAIAGFYGNV